MLLVRARGIGDSGNKNRLDSVEIQRLHLGLTYWTDGLLYSTPAVGDELLPDVLDDLQALLVDLILLVHVDLPLVVNVIRRCDGRVELIHDPPVRML